MCIICGAPSTERYTSMFNLPKEQHLCRRCALIKSHKNPDRIIKRKIQHKLRSEKAKSKMEIRYCVDCGKPSTLKPPRLFSQPVETYRCAQCANKFYLKKRVPDEIRVCIDCGKPSKPKNPIFFKQPQETYRCTGCANKIYSSSFERRKKISIYSLGITNEEWLDFVSNGKYCGLWTDPIIKVRKRVRARFTDKCVICGKTREEHNNKHMHVHHVYRKKDACCEGDKSDWLFATLCDSCHSKYGKKEVDILYIREILAIEYGNKCMLSLKEYNYLYPNGSVGDIRWGRTNGS